MKKVKLVLEVISIILSLMGYKWIVAGISLLCLFPIVNKKGSMNTMDSEQILYSLQDELSTISKFNGLKVTRMQNTITLKKAISAELNDFSLIKDKLLFLISLIDDQQIQDVLLMSLALSDDYANIPTLIQRRKKYCQNTQISIDNVLLLHTVGIEELSKIILKLSDKKISFPSNLQ